MSNTQLRYVSVFISLLFVIILTAAVRTFNYRHTSLDYDEHKTIVDELRLTDREHIFGYFILQNLWDYNHINHDHIGINNSICFPFYYIPMKLVYLLRSDLASLRL